MSVHVTVMVVLKIFPVILQTVISFKIVSIGGHFLQVNTEILRMQSIHSKFFYMPAKLSQFSTVHEVRKKVINFTAEILTATQQQNYYESTHKILISSI